MRWGSGATAAGAAGVVVLMALSPMAAAHVATNFTGVTWTPTLSSYLTGCVTGKAGMPGFNPSTGAGHWLAKTSAKTCPASRGGFKTNSEIQEFATIQVMKPVKLTAATHGVNVTWDAKITMATTAAYTGVPAPCPVTKVNYSYNFGYTWYNFSEAFALCDVEAIAQIYGFSYVHDITTNTYTSASNLWIASAPYFGVANLSGYQIYWFAYMATYSNSSYWASNYSGSYSANSTWGSPGAVSGTFTPTWFINNTGSWTSADKYEVLSYFDNYDAAQVVAWKHAVATASLNAATLGNHESLSSITVW